MRFISSSHLVTLLVGLCIGSLVLSVFDVMADRDPDHPGIPQVIPYQGVLELNGQAVNQAIHIEFQLYDSIDSNNPLYRQRIAVEVYQGRFTALIGPSGEEGRFLTHVVSASRDLYLGMVLLGDNLDSPVDDISMSNRQRLMSTPYAMWASGASQFTV